MRTMYFKIAVPYIYDKKNHSRAPYSVDGGKTWKNAGQFCELVIKAHLNLQVTCDGKRWDEGSDVEEYRASVKSANFSLTNTSIGATKEESIDNYFKHVASDEFWFAQLLSDDYVKVYKMQAEKFRKFLTLFGKYSHDRGVIRGGEVSQKMEWWLGSN